MRKSFEDNLVTQYCGDARAMTDLPDNSVQCVVTSPPYWGLRKYSGLPDLVWGDNHCEHQWGAIIPPPNAKSGKHQGDLGENTNLAQDSVRFMGSNGQFCSLCGAWKGQYGLEPTPDCGRPFSKLRTDLTKKELEYVTGELKRCGLI